MAARFWPLLPCEKDLREGVTGNIEAAKKVGVGSPAVLKKQAFPA